MKICNKCGSCRGEDRFRVRRGRLDTVCKDCQNAYHREYNRLNRRPKAKVAASNLKSRKKIREAVFSHYGRRCAACGEDDLTVLELDHINNDGAEHRLRIANMKKEKGKRGPSGHRLYYWLKANGFPGGVQTLCSNCNVAKHKNGGVLPEHRRIDREVTLGEAI